MQKVKLAQNLDGSAINFAMVMGGVIIEPETTLLPLSMVLKADAPAHSHLRGQPHGA